MRKRLIAVAAAALATVAAAGALAACGDSSTSSPASAQSARPGGGGMVTQAFSAALQSLVDDGTITPSQKTAVLEALSSAGPQGGPGGQGVTPGGGQGATPPSDVQGASPTGGAPQGGPPDMSSMFSSALDDLVSSGTITSAQQTAIVEALTAAMPQGGPGGGASPAATTAQDSV